MSISKNITFAVKEKTSVSDGMGGFTETWSIVAGLTSVSGAMRQLSGNELIQNEKTVNQTQYRFYCDVITITNRNTIYFNNEDYVILNVNNLHNRNHHLEIDTVKNS